ncbi:MAG: Coenzyme F420 hydrogenase/dehydrogenase, beta subunit C-terminal domain [Clostridium sp.]|nr:Coenzyme F420 hydrogenase/dehydrogenase, beta subunit C-terminal domain [Clostridium sp.]
MERDKEGFFYPVAEEAACINCDRCNRVCPVQKLLSVDDKEPLCYAAISRQDRQRAQSSSGGVFSLLAEKVLEQGGAVYGAAMEPDLTVRHLRITHTEDLPRLMGSKYVQSRMEDGYTRVRWDLAQGRKVLFSGTGCQVQGLLGYLGGPKPGLLTVDVICHGVPSEAVWRAYGRKIGAQTPLSFRDKSFGWLSFSMRFEEHVTQYYKDPYMRLFLSDVILRPSCYHCPAKGASRVSDLTLADFWGIQNVDPTMFDDKGTSLVLVHSAAGEQALAQIRSDLLLKAESLESAFAGNPNALHSATEPKARAAFFAEFEKRQGDLDYRRAADKYCLFYGKSVKQKAVACAKKLLRRG